MKRNGIIAVCAGLGVLGIAVLAFAAPPQRMALAQGELFKLWTPQVVATTNVVNGNFRITVRNFNLSETHPYYEPNARQEVGSVMLTLNGVDYVGEWVGDHVEILTPLSEWLGDFESRLLILDEFGDLITDRSLEWVKQPVTVTTAHQYDAP